METVIGNASYTIFLGSHFFRITSLNPKTEFSLFYLCVVLPLPHLLQTNVGILQLYTGNLAKPVTTATFFYGAKFKMHLHTFFFKFES